MVYDRELEHQKDLERLRKLRPIDDDFMRALLKDNIPLAELILRIIIGKNDLRLLSCETQMDMKRVTGARSICLDAYARDANGIKYDIEVQRADKGAEPHRARYHASVMDVENLDKGEDFSKLPEVYVIFITENDVFHTEHAIHFMRTFDQTTGFVFEDGRNILYVNGEYRGDSDIGKLMHDMNCSKASDMYYPLMAERTSYLKENEKGVSEMCALLEEMRDEYVAYGREEGREEGRAEGELKSKKETAMRLSKRGNSVLDIADILNVSSKQVEAWLSESLQPA